MLLLAVLSLHHAFNFSRASSLHHSRFAFIASPPLLSASFLVKFTGDFKACANGHADCVSALVDAGASFQPNGSGNTPLHWAAANGHLPVVNILLEKYAQV